MGPVEEDYIETVLTCEGDFYDPEFHTQLQSFSDRLQNLITTKGMCLRPRATLMHSFWVLSVFSCTHPPENAPHCCGFW